MIKASEKKTDRRTLYTRSAIKDAFLRLKQTKEYNAITVADLCREAEISRGTFYLHYKNIAEVLDALLAEVLTEITGLPEHLSLTEESPCSNPFCHYIRKNTKYRCILMDDTLTSYIINKIGERFMDDFVAQLMVRTTLSREQLESIFYFLINGCFAITKRDMRVFHEEWCSTQKTIDTFIKNGLDGYKRQAETS